MYKKFQFCSWKAALALDKAKSKLCPNAVSLLWVGRVEGGGVGMVGGEGVEEMPEEDFRRILTFLTIFIHEDSSCLYK